MPPLSAEEQKRKAAYYAVDTYLKSGMLVGLGTGSSVRYAVERLGEKIKGGELEKIEAIPTSEATKKQAEGLGIRLITLDVRSDIDVAIDGADEVDLGETTSLGLVKGAGGALYREKMIARQAAFFVVIGDESKGQKDGLGRTKLPVEVVPFSLKFVGQNIVALPSLHHDLLEIQLRQIESPLGEQKRGDLVWPSLSDLDRGTSHHHHHHHHHPTGRKAANEYSDDDPVKRKSEEDLVMQKVMRWTEDAFVTDNGNYIFDARFKRRIDNPEQVAKELSALEGVVAHGLFLDMSDVFVTVDGNGEIVVYESKKYKAKK